ncbi:hypothetical protein CGLO_16557 [Colletotrichum gloeosporioides Cg-14]|uniref:Uncharacterized protein n=1 Tax=Colletotrichum gloeosporioides (strain Cg-14) TaxID=1237896 RepID=T0KZ82_COLGC|nr:hypothetical protein CGLO_16557 [Colletotrichum gloeosporioides Cg-14]
MAQQQTFEVQPVRPDPQRLFYEAVVLEYALQKACRRGRQVFNETQAVENDPLATDVQVFHCFVEKLAQVCDNERGGKMVTAFSVLKGLDGPQFVFASNDRNEDELMEVIEFVESLLTLVGSNPAGLAAKPLAKRVLWKILHFNLHRVQEYLGQLAKYLDACIVDCVTRATPTALETLMPELETLKKKTAFPRDIVSGNAQTKFFSDCEKLLKGISIIKGTTIDQAITNYAREGHMAGSDLWRELRHYLGRFLSFRQASNAIVGAKDRFPALFHDFTITKISSSDPGTKPIKKSKSATAELFIRNMIQDDDDDREYFLEHAIAMQMFHLDDEIQRQIGKRTFRPRVHAEIQVHDHLLKKGLQHSSQYWNGWKYIGSSKPTCRLCSYYFGAHPDRMTVRKSHLNLYPNWRLPGLPEALESENPDVKVLHLLQQITERVQDDAKRTLEERRPVGRNHDSNTHSSMPSALYAYGVTDSMSMSEVAAALPRSLVGTGAVQGNLPMGDGGDDGFSLIGETDMDTPGENNDGVSVTA